MNIHGRTRSLTRGILSLFAGLLLVAGTSASADADEWRIASLAPDGSSWMKVMDKTAAEIEAKTSGRLKYKYYAGGVQGDEKDVIRKMKMGGLDGGLFTSVGLSQIEPSIRVLELPLAFASIEERDYVVAKMWGTFIKRFAKKGYVLGGPGDVGPIHFYSSTPVKTAADLRKAKVWLWGEDQIVKTMFRKLGINGVPMGVPDVLPALNTGRIDACYGSALALVALQWYTKIKYATTMTTNYAISSSAISKKVWDKLSPEDRKAVKRAMRRGSRALRKVVRRDNKRAHKAMIRAGVKEIETPAASIAAFEKVGQEVWSEMAGKLYSQRDLDRVLKYRAEFRAK